ncbi:tetratricopeptide repeat protein [Pseudothauera lacus]|nr:tetratricopeptide repeat protein [Pseudothauera lacus]
MLRFLFLALCVIVLLPHGAPAHAGDGGAAEHEARAHQAMNLEPPDWVLAREQFEHAAAGGSARAASYLGWMYENGHGVPPDHRLAAQWYERTARAGVPDYAVKLGWMYMGGSQLPADRERAEYWFGEAITAGHLPANIALASVLIADALGGLAPERVFEARPLLEQALDGGLPLAAFFLARLYVEGIGGHPRDEVLGARYTRISAEDGQALMQGWLARMYLTGSGVPEDRQEAAFWAALAAAGDDPLGRQLHAALSQELDDDSRRAVLERTMRWVLQRQPGAVD